MKPFALSTLFGFLGLFLTNSLVAVFVLAPLLNTAFGPYIRTHEQGLHLPAILSGYLILAIIMAFLYPRINWKLGWLKRGATFGLIMGLAVSLGGHLITAGWSTIPVFPMAVSGVFDALATTAGGITIAFVHRDTQ